MVRVILREGLGSNRRIVEGALDEIKTEKIMERIWARDHTVWGEDPSEISNRLGWLRAPEWTRERLPAIHAFVEGVQREGYRHVLLLGMGGASLAPKVITRIFGTRPGYLDVRVLDTTDPAIIIKETERLESEKTLVIVSSKSGTTVETESLMKYVFRRLACREGQEEAARHMVAITDPESNLAKIGDSYGFRNIFFNDPEIGGRYSALSLVGIVPAALAGVDCHTLLERAAQFAAMERTQYGEASAAFLGACMGELARRGRDKVIFLLSPALATFGEWVEQLIAESTGKEGKGILPVVMGEVFSSRWHGPDQFFVPLYEPGRSATGGAIPPFVEVELERTDDLGALFFLWELATAVAAHRLQVNPFDQPDVERAKKAARDILSRVRKEGTPPPESPDMMIDGVAVFGVTAVSHITLLMDCLCDRGDCSYIAIQAYVTPDDATLEALDNLRTALMDRYRKVVTVGFGPQYLHSTGQLHKGDGGKGVFVQLTEPDAVDVPIPDYMDDDQSTVTFGMLRKAQADGDRVALVAGKRRVVRFHFPANKVSILQRWSQLLEE